MFMSRGNYGICVLALARVARSQGCTVSLTTNGMNLTAAVQRQILEHLDMVAVSLDGARAETFERLRPGADFQQVTQQVAALCARKRSLKRPRPEVALLFMKMRPNVAGRMCSDWRPNWGLTGLMPPIWILLPRRPWKD
jgi:hypothetical protein